MPAKLAVLILSLTFVQGCAFNNARASRSESLTAVHQPGSRLAVDTHNGNVEITRDSAAGDVLIDAKITCSGKTTEEARQRLDAATIQVTRNAAGDLIIAPIFPDGVRGNDGASFTIRVPDAVGVDVESTNGKVTVRGLAGELIVNTSNGSVTIADHEGAATIRTSNGNVNVERLGGPLQAHTSNGTVQASGVAGSAQVYSSNGSITLSLDPNQTGPLKLQTSNGSVKAHVGSAFEGKVKLNTSNGSIRIVGQANQIKSTIIDGASGTIVLNDAEQISVIATSNGKIEFGVVQ